MLSVFLTDHIKVVNQHQIKQAADLVDSQLLLPAQMRWDNNISRTPVKVYSGISLPYQLEVHSAILALLGQLLETRQDTALVKPRAVSSVVLVRRKWITNR
jgi:hypothetical protein